MISSCNAIGSEPKYTTPVFAMCRRKQAAAASRKDAKLQYVVISEKWDK